MNNGGYGGPGSGHNGGGYAPRDSSMYRASVIDVIDIDGSGSALRLEPIRPSTMGFGASPPLHSYSRSNSGGQANGMMLPPQGRPRRTSTDEIRALLQRTNNALDKIVKIRESMEPFVDFKQFDKNKPPRRTSSGTLSRWSAGLDEAPVAGGHRANPASSYGSVASDDQLGDRSTGSTESTSSADEGASTHDFDSSRGDDIGHRSGSGAAADDHSQRSNREGDLSDIDDDDDDTFSSIEELPPFKEARLDRLKNITITFHEGLPTEFFMALTRFLHSSLEIKTRHSRFSFFKDTFVGSDAVRDMIVSGFADDQPMALRYGNVLVKLGYIEHVSRTDDQLHNNKDNFYRFTKAIDHEGGDNFRDTAARASVNATNFRESTLSTDSSATVEYDFAEASNEVHALVTDEVLVVLSRVLHKVFERKNKLLFYKGFSGCFLGAEAVNVIREMRVATSLVDAVLIGQALLDEKIIEPIATTVTTFQDRYVFYRLARAQS